MAIPAGMGMGPSGRRTGRLSQRDTHTRELGGNQVFVWWKRAQAGPGHGIRSDQPMRRSTVTGSARAAGGW